MWNIPMAGMRGQGYGNRAKVWGGDGFKNIFLKANPHGFFVPYSAHTPNLINSAASKLNSSRISFYLYSINQEKSIMFFVKLRKMRILIRKFNMKFEICAPN